MSGGDNNNKEDKEGDTLVDNRIRDGGGGLVPFLSLRKGPSPSSAKFPNALVSPSPPSSLLPNSTSTSDAVRSKKRRCVVGE